MPDNDKSPEAQRIAELEAQVKDLQGRNDELEQFVNTLDGQQTTAPADALTQDNSIGTLAQIAAQGRDPSNTYENGVPGNVNSAIPKDADVTTSYEDALDRGYIGYAPGAAATAQYSAQAAGNRNQRLREARRAVVNRSAEDEDGHTADPKPKARAQR